MTTTIDPVLLVLYAAIAAPFVSHILIVLWVSCDHVKVTTKRSGYEAQQRRAFKDRMEAVDRLRFKRRT